jgi:hypothetical protein
MLTHIGSGGFDGSCKNIHMSGTVLTATCPDSAGNEHNPSIDTSEFYFNCFVSLLLLLLKNILSLTDHLQ